MSAFVFVHANSTLFKICETHEDFGLNLIQDGFKALANLISKIDHRQLRRTYGWAWDVIMWFNIPSHVNFCKLKQAA